MKENQQINAGFNPELVILVDENDQETGTMEKMEAHRNGCMHRAISVFIFDSEGKMLLQQRSLEKYHCSGKWSNACCTHPRPGETVQNAAERRLMEEMGFITKLNKAFDFSYRAELENGLIENEFDHVFFGEFSGEIIPDSREVTNWRFASTQEIEMEIREMPESFTPWFILLYSKINSERG